MDNDGESGDPELTLDVELGHLWFLRPATSHTGRRRDAGGGITRSFHWELSRRKVSGGGDYLKSRRDRKNGCFTFPKIR